MQKDAPQSTDPARVCQPEPAALANGAYGFFILPESLPRDRRSPLRANPVGSFQLLRSHAELAALAIVNLILVSAAAITAWRATRGDTAP